MIDVSKLIATVAAATAVLLWGEVVHWRSSRRHLGSGSLAGSREAVVVLGYKNSSHRANLINRYRVLGRIRTQPRGQHTTLVLSGGSVSSHIPESEVMARYARDILHYDAELVTETESRSTWENIRNVIPLIEDAGQIKIVSNALHAEKGRLYLRRLRPDLAERLVKSDDYRFGELVLLKPIMAMIGLKDLHGLRT